ncbi:DegV family protein [Georgenia subflava]|uniref:DegV family EDD domain-containing protein n=1 Tax=Georgenia subflava TaxID=1622177 RepID=A0A6N7EGR6_9MICO|nr:DegV family protein [Georgenia subflava]MPV37562.1 DegV family EDD domain-containing protein [Georgenia subflava]
MAAAEVAVVTDSTASLPAEVAAGLGITVVPLHVVVDGVDRLDDAVGSTDLAARMAAGRTVVTTSQPSTAELAAAMRAASQDGRRAVVAVHLSAELSGTVAGARRAAEQLAAEGIEVHVVDSRTVAGGTGLTAVAAAEAAAAGRTAPQVVAVARETAAKSTVLFAVPDLATLQRGGRMGTGAAFVGAALGIRPVLGIADGRIVVVETVRGLARARRRVLERAVQAAGGPRARVPHPPAVRVRLAVHHFGDHDAALALQEDLAEGLASTGALVAGALRSELTAVVGAHAGPRVVGVVVAPAG